MDDEKIPVDKVLDDMYSPDGGPVSWAARDYYYREYATEEEKREMDREDTFTKSMVRIIRVVLGFLVFIFIITNNL